MTTSRYYRDKLTEATNSARRDTIDNSVGEWRKAAELMTSVSDKIRSKALGIQGELEGDSGEQMVAKINAIGDKLELDAQRMLDGATALDTAAAAVLAAEKVNNGIYISGGFNVMPTKPEGALPGAPPTTEQTTALATYNANVQQFEATEAALEEKAKLALQEMDQGYGEAAQVMAAIHGETPPQEPSGPSTPSQGPGAFPPPPPATPDRARAIPRTATPRTATPRTATPTPRTPTPRTPTPKTPTPKTPTPKTPTPKTRTPRSGRVPPSPTFRAAPTPGARTKAAPAARRPAVPGASAGSAPSAAEPRSGRPAPGWVPA